MRERSGGGKETEHDRGMSTPAVDIGKLAPQERLSLISELWESLRSQPAAIPITPAHKDELDCRLDALDRGDAAVLSWDEAKRLLRG